MPKDDALLIALKKRGLRAGPDESPLPSYLNADTIRVSCSVRVSKIGDRSGERFMSPEIQVSELCAAAVQGNWHIVSWHSELDVGGGTTAREGLQAAISEAMSGESDGIAVARVDRFSRNMLEGLIEVKRLRDAGKHFLAPGNGIGIVSDDPMLRMMGDMLLGFMLMLAQCQLEQLKASWRSAIKTHVGNGVANKTPFGYVKSESTRKLVVSKREAQCVRRMFRMRADGHSWPEIAAVLDDGNVPPPSGGRWSHNSVRNMVMNRAYLGELRIGSEVNTSAHPAIVTRELFDAAAATFDDAVRCEAVDFPVAVRCATCGGRMAGQNTPIPATGVSPAKMVRYYRCRRRFSWGTCPRPAACRADELEAIVFAQMSKDTKGRKFKGTTTDATLDLEEAKLDELNAVLRRYLTLPQYTKLERDDPETYDAGLAKRVADRDAQAAIVDELRRTSVSAQVPQHVLSAWDDDELLSPQERRQALSICYPVIAVKPSENASAAKTEPLSSRLKIWRIGDRKIPTGLPGRVFGPGAKQKAGSNQITRIDF